LVAAPAVAAMLPRAAMHLTAMPAVRPLTLASTRGTYAGPLAPGEPVSILVRLAGKRDAELDRFVESLQSGASLSPRYLTPQEYGSYFGADPLVYGRAIAALRSAGFTIDDLPANRTDIVAHAPASRVAAFFATPLDRRVENGRVFFTARYEPLIPPALAAVAISGLDDYVQFHPLGFHRRSPHGKVNGSWTPADLAGGYNLNPLYAKGLDGKGTIIANVTCGAALASDVATFQAHFGLPNVPMVSTAVGGSLQTGCATYGNGESSLDAASATSIARGATFHQVVAHGLSNHDFDLAYEYVVNNLGSSVHVATTSWGVCERYMGKTELTIDEGDFKQAEAEGQFWFAASGDYGTDDCGAKGPISVDYPGSSPYVISVGGTNITGKTNGGVVSWASETTWQYTSSDDSGASGGGESILYAKPPYQKGVTPSKYTMRLVPDVALIADPGNDGVYLCINGQIEDDAGGTSEASPMWAGFLAIVEQNKIAKRQKLIDPHVRLYQLAKTSAYKSVFHDIVSGYNGAPAGTDPYGTFPGYYAGPGFDLTTGLGSFNGAPLLAAY
jgi:kumamolisin